MNKYFKDFILCGEITHRCLLCEKSFYYITDIEKHIRMESHKQLVVEQNCILEFIYKLYGQYYYCILCNDVTLDSAALGEHLSGEGHQAAITDPKTVRNRPAGVYRRPYIIIHDYPFTVQCWQSIVINICLVCIPHQYCEVEHSSTTSHMIKIIQCKTRVHANGHYRKLNDKMYQCYKCKTVISTEDGIKRHLEKNVCILRAEMFIKEAFTSSIIPEEKLAVLCRIEEEDEEASAIGDGATIDKDKTSISRDVSSADGASASGDGASTRGDRASTSRVIISTSTGEITAVYVKDSADRDEASTSRVETSRDEDSISRGKAETLKSKTKAESDEASMRKDEDSTSRVIVSISKDKTSAVYDADRDKSSTSKAEASADGTSTSRAKTKTRKGRAKARRDEASIQRDVASISRESVSISKSETSGVCVEDEAGADRDGASTSRDSFSTSKSETSAVYAEIDTSADRVGASTSRDSLSTSKSENSAVYVKDETSADRDGVSTSRVKTRGVEASTSKGKAKTRKGRTKAGKGKASIKSDQKYQKGRAKTRKGKAKAGRDGANIRRDGASTSRDSVSTSKSETSAVCVGDKTDADRDEASTSKESASVSVGESSGIRDRVSTSIDEKISIKIETSNIRCDYRIIRNVDDTGRRIRFYYRSAPISMLEHEQSIESESFDEEAEGVICKGIVDYGKRRALLSQYAKKHNIKLNSKSTRGLCILCNVYIMHANRNAFRLHAASILHKCNMEMKTILYPTEHTLCPYDKLAINSDRVHTRYLFNYNYKFWINKRYCIDLHSFLLIYEFQCDPHYRKIRCFVCETIFPREKYREHCLSIKHENYFKATGVLSISEEFIREIKPFLYHCGFCNKTLPFWETVKAHLKKESHNRMKLMRLTPTNLELTCSSYFLHIYSKDIEEFYIKIMTILP